MHNTYFQQCENLKQGDSLDLDTVINNLAFNEQDLVAVITQAHDTKEVLMFAWMNKEAIYHTLKTGYMTYYSRSRQELWEKGKTSGHVQQMVSMTFDCDGDAILCQVMQTGAACHTGRKNCFYLDVDLKNKKVCIQH